MSTPTTPFTDAVGIQRTGLLTTTSETMAGVRGFSDPNVQKNDGVPVWQQPVNATTYLTPWYLNYLRGTGSMRHSA